MIAAVLRTFVLYFAVLFAMRLMGKRQLGELQPSELATTFLISNVATLSIDEPDLPLLASLVPIFLLAALEILHSSLVWICPQYARLLFGKPITVIRNGEIDQQALHHLRLTGADLLEALRDRDIDTPEEVTWGVVESNGSISAATRQEKQSPFLPLVVDRMLYHDNLTAFGKDEAWLTRQLADRGLSTRQVLLCLYDGQTMYLVPQAKRQGGA